MRTTVTRYPVDRYLVESSKKYDMINITDDDIWNYEPALRPEDETILRKLQDMLQSTADDLKLLSGELSKNLESGVQKKIIPTPLDEDFNEKVHIEEVVNAKFRGHKLGINNLVPLKKHKNVFDKSKPVPNTSNMKQFVNHGVQVNQVATIKKPCLKKKLNISRTNVVQIHENPIERDLIDNSYTKSKNRNEKSIVYSEIIYKDTKPQHNLADKTLQIQKMPSINIRSELREQKVLQLDIIPEINSVPEEVTIFKNSLVVEMKHENISESLKSNNPLTFIKKQSIPDTISGKLTTRKISKMPTCESSESTSNISSDSHQNLRKQKVKASITQRTPRVFQKYENPINKKKLKRPTSSIDEWHKKLNSVYGTTSKLKYPRVSATNLPQKSSKRNVASIKKSSEANLNNEYIPYSKLTIGGVNVSDIEREIFDIPNKNEIVLSPILDKILNSRENSFHNDSPRKNKNSKILTASDENLLQEVLDINNEVTKTLAQKKISNSNQSSIDDQCNKSNPKEVDSYDDDFEDEKIDDSEHDPVIHNSNSSLESILPSNSRQDDTYNNASARNITRQQDERNIHNKTYTKISNLSFKNSVDVFEFVHSVETQETGTQSNTSLKVSSRQNQTSPKNDKPEMQPIHNDLWPTIDPKGKVEKMFQLEKEFIQKLIMDEYGDLLEQRFDKPSTSRNIDTETSRRNIVVTQKNTQTSPAHVRSIMTSPTRTKTRTTSPFALSLSADKQTSPIVLVSNEEELKVEIENDDLGISVNLSSPRFSLRLPQTSLDVFSNIKADKLTNDRQIKQNNIQKNVFSSSSSVDGDYSSSDISSLGEINKMYKRKLKKSRLPSNSNISSSSSLSRYSTDPSGAVIRLKSEGETSVGQINKKKSRNNKSEGEISYGQLN